MTARDRIAQVTAKHETSRLKAERASDGLAARLVHGRNLRRRVSWPGTAVELDLAVLSQSERSQAMAAAIVELRRRGIDDGKPQPEHVEPAAVEHIVQILSFALRDPEGGARVFANGTDLADAATEDEIAVLWRDYSEFRREVDPDASELPEPEWRAFIEAVKKKEAVRWSAIASGWPRSWLLTSVDRLANSLTSNSSSTDSFTEPLETTTNETDDETEPASSERS